MKKNSWYAWALLSPALIIMSVFIFYPAIESVVLSLHDVDPYTQAKTWVGAENYTALFHSPDYWSSLTVSAFFVFYTTIPSIVLSLLIALGLDMQPFFRGLFRTVFLMPISISSAMAAMLWLSIYNPSAGYLNYLLGLVHIDGPNWLGDPKWALISVSIATVWKEVGFNIIFFLAALSSVPPELEEAAHIDGASAWQKFRNVIVPIISPTILFVTVVSIINSFQSFGQIHILTMGGPSGSTNILVYNLYRDAFVNFRAGYASAQAIMLFVLLMTATAIQFRFARQRVHYA